MAVSPSLETANLHAALGDMTIQSTSAGTTPSPTAPLASGPEPYSAFFDHSQAATSQGQPPQTTGASSSTSVKQGSAQSPTSTTNSNTVSKSMEPPRKKFVYDPASMLLPHERLAQQRAAPPQPPSAAGFNPALYRPTNTKNHTPVQSNSQAVAAQQHDPPPPYTTSFAINGQNPARDPSRGEMCMPTRAAPPLPPSANNRQPTGSSKSGIPLVNRNNAWVDSNAVDPLQKSPIINTGSDSENDSEDEDEEGMSANDSRGKKRGRSERTNSGGGSSDNRGTRNGVVRASLSDWEIVETLGTGTFGRVLLVRVRPSYRPLPYHPIFPKLQQPIDPNAPNPRETAEMDKQLPHFAMKVLNKAEIVRLKQVEHINSERAILERVRHPFLVELYGTYQDHLNVYMLLSYIPGGELFSHLRRAGRFTADVTRFYLASIILAIDYLHARDIIYRDLKPENLLLDRDGYLRIADFGFAKIVEDRTFTLCGTPEYLAPEIVLSKGHGKAVDWWALGILCFEMLCGYPPFFDDHPLGIYEKIIANKVAFPSHVDPYAKDLIRRLLTADRSKRLGNLRGGAKDVMAHRWFTGVDWSILESKRIAAPIIPHVANRGDSQNFQRYAPPLPQELPGILGIPQGNLDDPYKQLFQEFVFPSA
ncbi:hypothetical protein NliqN6_2690 [Naganishia liquefaciens]|uniref:cAMP-dependent protein kinase n=1 Tax=Naganishia liquefaciens TaxID=104408 RepID=A0A8H3YEI2_9TREE|nr:hypothetical protein NliqN6_2690 [Naganishia liquefaciens]